MQNYQKDKEETEDKLFIQLSKTNCPPCKVLKQHMTDNKYPGIKYVYFSFDSSKDNMAEYNAEVDAVIEEARKRNLMALPIVGIIKNGELLDIATVRSASEMKRLINL